MSRIGKKPIEIPEKVEVTVAGDLVTVKGPKGDLKMNFLNNRIDIKVEGRQVILTLKKEDLESRALWGTYASLVINMIEGVTKGYEKRLIIEGVGYKVEVKGEKVSLSLGYVNPVLVDIPAGIKIAVEKDNIIISGIDKQLVGETAAVIRSHKKPEPYKGKGIRYAGELIRRKEGKKAA